MNSKLNRAPTKVAVWPFNYSSSSRVFPALHTQTSAPTLLRLPENAPFKFFALRGRAAYAISQEGKPYTWSALDPFSEAGFQVIPDVSFLAAVPKPVRGLEKTSVAKVSCSDRAAMFVSLEGLLFSMGSDIKTRSGILGLSNLYYQGTATVVGGLRGCRVTQVSVGARHAAALDCRGNVFLWGSGSGVQTNSNVPLQLQIEKDLNGRQVLSAPNATLIIACTP